MLADLKHEWAIVKPVLIKSLLLKIAYFIMVIFMYSSENLLYSVDLIWNTVYNPNQSKLGSGILGMSQWDGAYFLHAMLHDYPNLKTFAFYPGFPAVVSTIVKGIFQIPIFGAFLTEIPLSMVMMTTGITVNLLCHLANSWLLYQWLRMRWFSQSQARMGSLLFGLGGNAIFHVALYSESTYMFATLLPLYILAKAGNNPSSMSLLKFTLFTFAFGMSGFFRSVGLMNGAYVGYPLLLEFIYLMFKEKNIRKAASVFLRILIVIVAFLTPAVFLHFKTRRLFCHAATPEDPYYTAPGFCDNPTGYFYSYIQDNYWNVRLFDYIKNPYHMDVWVFAFVSFTILTIWLVKAYTVTGLRSLASLHIPEYLSNRNLQSARILELPEIVAFTIQYCGYYAYAHLGSVDRFWCATPAYFIFNIVAQQTLVRISNHRDKDTAPALWRRPFKYIIPFNLVVRQVLVPVFFALRVIPI